MLFQWTTHYIKASSYEIGGNHGIVEKKVLQTTETGMETRFSPENCTRMRAWE